MLGFTGRCAWGGGKSPPLTLRMSSGQARRATKAGYNNQFLVHESPYCNAAVFIVYLDSRLELSWELRAEFSPLP